MRVKAPAELQVVLGGRPSYWSDLLRDEAKAFGEKVARRIEEAMGWPDRCLDQEEPEQDQSQTRVAHTMSYQPDTVPAISWEELTVFLGDAKELPAEFWLTLGDDAMGPRAVKGTRIKFSRSREPVYGDAVLLTGPDGKPHVRVYAQSLSRGFAARPTNDDYDPFYGDMPGVQIIAVMSGIETGWAQLAR